MSKLPQRKECSTDKELSKMYNTVFSLLEEEVYQRMHPETYKDSKFDGSFESISGMHNVNLLEADEGVQEGAHDGVQKGGGKNTAYIPGKIDAIRTSYAIPLMTAIEGTIGRHQLYAKELGKDGIFANNFC